ncbi:YybH family protein [Dyella subtropica]|uniref:YybH family protein n=1 Tax=Dyella subtropica TaxID=2992127 RepID=UPI0022548F12|nr:nuclear transport factor 2 family protein [Dyella subtropica]
MKSGTFSRWVGVLLLAVSLASFAASPPAATDDATAIRQVMAAQEAAWNRGDVDAFMQAYKDSPDTTFIGSRVRKGYQPILENYRKNYASKAQMGTLSFSDIDVRLLPCADGHTQYAAVTGRFHLERSSHGDAAKDDGVYLLLWEKTGDGWKMIMDHSS